MACVFSKVRNAGLFGCQLHFLVVPGRDGTDFTEPTIPSTLHLTLSLSKVNRDCKSITGMWLLKTQILPRRVAEPGEHQPFSICLQAPSPTYFVAGNTKALTLLSGELGISVCLLSFIEGPSTCFNDTSWQDAFVSTTSFAFSLRRGTTYYSFTNTSLLDVSDLSPPIHQNITSDDLFQVFDQFFYVSSDLTQTANEALIIWIVSVLISATVTRTQIGGPQSFFRALLATPSLLLQPNILGDNSTEPYTEPVPGLPSTFYVTTKLAESRIAIHIAKWTTIVYTVMYCWCICFLCWHMRTQGPNISAFPLLDFASRVVAGRVDNGSPGGILSRLSYGSNGLYKRGLKAEKFYLVGLPRGVKEEGEAGSEPESAEDVGPKRIGFSTDGGAERLKLNGNYEA